MFPEYRAAALLVKTLVIWRRIFSNEKKKGFVGSHTSNMSSSLPPHHHQQQPWKCVLNSALLLCSRCNILSCESAVSGARTNLLLLVIFSFSPQWVGNKPTFSLLISSNQNSPPSPSPSRLLPWTNFAAGYLYTRPFLMPQEKKKKKKIK